MSIERAALLEGKKRLPPRYDRDGLDLGTPLVCPEPTLALQSEKDSCDINIIMRNYVERGQIPPYGREGVYADVTNAPSYEQAMEAIINAEKYFEKLPAHIRNVFNDNPGTFLDFMADPDNLEMSFELGVRQRPEAAAPAVPPTPPAPSTPGEKDPPA